MTSPTYVDLGADQSDPIVYYHISETDSVSTNLIGELEPIGYGRPNTGMAVRECFFYSTSSSI